jgi:3-deoxy-D-manno-octulosonic-acid transferase
MHVANVFAGNIVLPWPRRKKKNVSAPALPARAGAPLYCPTMYLAYSLLLGLGLLLASPYFLWKGRGTGKYLQTFWRRLHGASPITDKPGGLWIHAVSVGEVIETRALVDALRERFPGRPVFISTTTTTGQALARDRFAGIVDGIFYMPFDFAFSVRRALRRVRPRLLVLVETEIWPNLLREARRHGAAIAIVNGRLSPGSFANYRKIRRLLRPVFDDIALFLMQGEAHAQRIRALGADPDRVRVLGNLKYDSIEESVPPPSLRAMLSPAGAGPLWIAGSTVDGEEELVLDAWRRVRASVPHARLLIAPRRPERFSTVADVVARRGFAVARRSQLSSPAPADAVLVLDSMGELPSVYSLGVAVFVGGSLVDRGGHNILEPAIAGKVVIVGAHLSNFAEMEAAFRAAEAFVQVESVDGLAVAVTRALTDAAWVREMGEKARHAAASQKGAAAATAEALRPLLQ